MLDVAVMLKLGRECERELPGGVCVAGRHIHRSALLKRQSRDQVANICWIIKKQESSRKTSTSALLTT